MSAQSAQEEERESSASGQRDEPDQAGTQKNLARPSAEEIYRAVAVNAQDELQRTTAALAISGFAGGVFMGLSALGTAMTLGMFGKSPQVEFVAKMFYPLGFIVVILGRAQLFTENTLYPVALVLAEKRELWNTVRLWCTVLPANVLGALTFAALVAKTSALAPATVDALANLGIEAVQKPSMTIFWSAVTAGWIIATAAWLVSGSHSISGSIIVIWLLTFVVGLGNFAHCIATSGEILSAVLRHQVGLPGYLHWLSIAVAGNVCGGVFMVTVLEYGQVILGKDADPVKDSVAEDR